MVKKIIYSFLFFSLFTIVFSQEEIMTVETLKRKKEATLDIEVTKIKSIPLPGIIDEENKKIIFDFKELKAEAKRKKIRIDENNYDMFLMEKLDKLWDIKSGIKKEVVQNKNLTYRSVDKNGEKILEISYEIKPENIYIGVMNKNTKNVEKVFKGELKKEEKNIIQKGIDDFDYIVSNNQAIIIDPSFNGEYISEPIKIKFQQIKNAKSKLFPVITIGKEDVWKKNNYNSMLPTEGKIDDIAASFFNSEITGKIMPELKYKNSYPNNNIGQNKRVYLHNILGEKENKIAIGAYENPDNITSSDELDKELGKEFVEAEVRFKLDTSTVEQLKSYASKATANSENLVEIKYKNPSENNISLVVASSNENAIFDIPGKNLNENRINIPYPKIYVRKVSDEYERYFSYSTAGLKDGVIDEEGYFNEDGTLKNTVKDYIIVSLGSVKVTQEEGAYDKDRTPAIGIGEKNEWSYTGKINSNWGIRNIGEINHEINNIKLNMGKNFEIYPYLIGQAEAGKLAIRKINTSIGNQLADKNRSVTVVAFGSVDRVVGELKIAISKEILKKIKDYAYERNENMVEIPYADDYKISLIPSSKVRNGIVQPISIPDDMLGLVRKILYPKIKFKKITGNAQDKNNFRYDHNLKSTILGEENFYVDKSIEDLVINFGTIEFSQKESLGTTDNLIPMIAFGKRELGLDGYFIDGDTTLVSRNNFKSEYMVNGATGKSINLTTYFKKISGETLENSNKDIKGGQQKSMEGLNLGAWIYSRGEREKIQADINIKISTENKKDILKIIRAYPKSLIQFNTLEKVNLVEGKYEGKYIFPIENNNSRITEIQIPSIEIVKDKLINNNILIEFKAGYKKRDTIKFDISGKPNNENVLVDLNSGVFMNGLPYNSGGIGIIDNVSKVFLDGDNKFNINKDGLNMDLTYKEDGTVEMAVNSFGSTESKTFEIIHKEVSNEIRRSYKVTIKTPAPRFEVISKEELDFGTVFRGDNTKIAQAKIELKNLSGGNLLLNSNTKKVDLKNGDSTIRAEIYDIGAPIKKENSEVYILEGKLIETQDATLEGEHRGTIILNVNIE